MAELEKSTGISNSLRKTGMPTISIGMPVYNSAKNIRAALDSMLSQTFSDFIIIVSDNASTDGTGDIVQHYAGRDPRVIYIKQPENIGAVDNFKFVFRESRSEYFMWAADDDTRSKDFLERNFQFLENNPNYLGSTLRARFQGGQFNPVKMGDASLDQDDFASRVIDFFGAWHANSRFYSLFRRSALVPWVNNDWGFPGSDWALVIGVVSRGKLNRINEGWVELGRDGLSNTTDIFSSSSNNFISWMLPFYRLAAATWEVMALSKASQRLHVGWRLIWLNIIAFFLQHKLMLRGNHRDE